MSGRFQKRQRPPGFVDHPLGTPLSVARKCPSCKEMHPAGTTCATGWAPWSMEDSEASIEATRKEAARLALLEEVEA